MKIQQLDIECNVNNRWNIVKLVVIQKLNLEIYQLKGVFYCISESTKEDLKLIDDFGRT